MDTPWGEVSLEVRGSGPGPVVLLLHANPGDSRDFAALAERLVASRAVATVDWPGYGRSTVTDPGTVTAESLVRIGGMVLAELRRRGADRVAIVGNSVGGYVAARLAVESPEVVSRVVLVDAAGFTKQNVLSRFFCRRVMGSPGMARWIVAPLARAYLGSLRDPRNRAIYDRAREVRRDPIRLAVHCALWRSFADPGFDLTGEDMKPAVPVMLIWGRRDPVVPYWLDGRRARWALPQARYVTLPAGHESFSERPEDFWRHVGPFLAEDLDEAR